MATLSDAERGMLADWWESEWPDTAAGALGTLAETVEAILTARLAKVEALATCTRGRDGSECADCRVRPDAGHGIGIAHLRVALASDPTHTQNGIQA